MIVAPALAQAMPSLTMASTVYGMLGCHARHPPFIAASIQTFRMEFPWAYGTRSIRARAQRLPGVDAVNIAHERRMDGVADQFARPLRQFFRDLGGHGEHHVLELAEPARAILWGDDQARTIRAVGAAAVPERAL